MNINAISINMLPFRNNIKLKSHFQNTSYKAHWGSDVFVGTCFKGTKAQNTKIKKQNPTQEEAQKIQEIEQSDDFRYAYNQFYEIGCDAMEEEFEALDVTDEVEKLYNSKKERDNCPYKTKVEGNRLFEYLPDGKTVFRTTVFKNSSTGHPKIKSITQINADGSKDIYTQANIIKGYKKHKDGSEEYIKSVKTKFFFDKGQRRIVRGYKKDANGQVSCESSLIYLEENKRLKRIYRINEKISPKGTIEADFQYKNNWERNRKEILPEKHQLVYGFKEEKNGEKSYGLVLDYYKDELHTIRENYQTTPQGKKKYSGCFIKDAFGKWHKVVADN